MPPQPVQLGMESQAKVGRNSHMQLVQAHRGDGSGNRPCNELLQKEPSQDR